MSVCGNESKESPARAPDALVLPGFAFDAQGRRAAPLLPSDESPWQLAIDGSGVLCYYHTDIGYTQWEPLEGCTPLHARLLAQPTALCGEARLGSCS